MRNIVRNGAHCKKNPEKTQVQKRYVIVAYHASDKNLGLICERQIVAENKINHNLVERHTCNVEGTLMQKEQHGGRRGLMDRASASYPHGAKGLGFNPPWRPNLCMLTL